MTDRYLISQMMAVVQEVNPEYPLDKNLDAKPLLKIADFLYKQAKLTYGSENNASVIAPVWRIIYTLVIEDPFYGQKSLSTIANHIQEFYQKTAYGDRKNAKLSANKLKQKIAARYAGRKAPGNKDASDTLF